MVVREGAGEDCCTTWAAEWIGEVVVGEEHALLADTLIE